MEQIRQIRDHLTSYLERLQIASSKREIVLGYRKAEEIVNNYAVAEIPLIGEYDASKLSIDLDQELLVDKPIDIDLSPGLMELSVLDRQVKSLLEAPGEYVPKLQTTIRRLGKQMNSVRQFSEKEYVDLTELGRSLAPQVTHMTNVLSRFPLRDLLGSINRDYKDLDKNINEITNDISKAVQDGEVAIVEAHFYSKIELLEQARVLLDRQVSLITDEMSWAPPQVTMMSDRQGAVTKNIDYLLMKSDQKAKDLQRDLDRLNLAMTSKNEEYQSIQTAYEFSMKESEKLLQENQQLNEEVWTRLRKLESEAQGLCKVRMEELNRRWRIIEDHKKRTSIHAEYTNFYQKRKTLLLDGLTNCEAYRRCGEMLKESSKLMYDGLSFNMTAVSEDLEKLQNKASLSYFQNFRQLYLTIGELIYKKERHIEELNEQAQNALIHMEMKAETLNPIAKKHANDLQTCRTMINAINSEISTLRKKQDVAISSVKTHEDRLKSKGILPPVHPSDELEDIILNRKEMLVEYHELKASSVYSRPSSASGRSTPSLPSASLRSSLMATPILDKKGSRGKAAAHSMEISY
eukprot:NODE_1491_length_1932_cov_41.325041_g1264_i0.p1 GENE.NODE_1491_length_1932_cov_41.325041_g1264_i0~~NODE_1491_length_1932_cov_41.325041_g1264_i0.p1  ORF type:complete len:576 (+),score=108.56 NODE_1491_length_1932_cov_41.325041_g1264_i0:89-1816(+)